MQIFIVTKHIIVSIILAIRISYLLLGTIGT